MSKLRPTLRTVVGEPALTYEQTYYRVFQAVSSRRGLIHGKLRDEHGAVCAIGAYFQESDIAIKSTAIDEIAAYNDSFPNLTPHARWRKVMAWLRTRVGK